MNTLVDRYSLPLPRYTSYPPASSWSALTEKEFISHPLKGPISLYFHIPFCTSQCIYCGCQSIPCKDPHVHEQYVLALLQEIRMAAKTFPGCSISHIHFGGGTPNILSTSTILSIVDTVRGEFPLLKTAEFALEVDPRLPCDFVSLAKKGFNRVSLGVQDIDPRVQEAIGRRQSQEVSEKAFTHARKAGMSINIDLVYGLPFQTKNSFSRTIDWILSIRPDRLAIFPFAYLPDLKPHQKGISPESLPQNREKFQLFVEAKEKLTEHGYRAIGMDHFALPHDPLAKGTIHRNFQGYSVGPRTPLLGLGVTAISDYQRGFFQHTKDLTTYMAAIARGNFPIERGALLSCDDQIHRSVIDQLMCQYTISKQACETVWNIHFDSYFAEGITRLSTLISDGLVSMTTDEIHATESGRLFLKNIAACFDPATPRNHS